MPPTEQLTLPLAAPPVPARMVKEFVYKPEIGYTPQSDKRIVDGTEGIGKGTP